MTEQCKGRILRDGEHCRGRFANGRRFFLEFRCSAKTKEELCSRCQDWKNRGLKKRDPYRNHYGLIDEELPKDSHIFGSSWYESKVEDYGHPSEECMVRAKKAQEEARVGVDSLQEPVKEPVKVAVKEEPMKGVAKEKAVKEKGKRKPASSPAVAVTLEPLAIEAGLYTEDLQIERRSVTRISYNNTEYLMDNNKNVYTVDTFKLVGLWDDRMRRFK